MYHGLLFFLEGNDGDVMMFMMVMVMLGARCDFD